MSNYSRTPSDRMVPPGTFYDQLQRTFDVVASTNASPIDWDQTRVYDDHDTTPKGEWQRASDYEDRFQEILRTCLAGRIHIELSTDELGMKTGAYVVMVTYKDVQLSTDDDNFTKPIGLTIGGGGFPLKDPVVTTR